MNNWKSHGAITIVVDNEGPWSKKGGESLI